ncbi:MULTISPECIES: aromatic/alkene monooxygenase hydroxylase subunit beta [Hydrogenophaga]|jgi:toluene monooxygenase system protein E|uniref:aromatic/alkene monooxygenase hydroxylase subunit beta n=1 Tax=Hydrogenophaga TaxID=47420 RepID=UPI001CF98F75|nr:MULTISPECIES: aromatic/alkene monooxygenase hydroxylase subunit beta [Hydrogenophaga]MDO9029650.1 aromatic/alkene monooxygenase hydroxylase subunit beta [Hydrogenophaga sp.]UCU94661.1 aromatic/alkene monooxygenase hydroxylase subunit beta [Hydrogenophaga taeniospiralis]
MTQPDVLKPLKTWSHLAGRRRKPSEYEIVSTNLHYSTDNPDAPFELDPNFAMALWFKQHRNASPLKHPDWDAFRDPDEMVYRTYNLQQDGQETYVQGLFEQFSARGHDSMLDPTWAGSLARLYTPTRYLFHTLQMASAYLSQMAPASTISNCATYQTADSLRWLTHTAYRTAELAKSFPGIGLGSGERAYWENDPAWQGWRQLIEKALVAWDWAESFTAFSLVIRPAVEEGLLRTLGDAGRHNSDTLLGLLVDAQLLDAQRQRRWASTLTRMALEQPGNREVIQRWVQQWEPLADAAIAAYCAALPDAAGAAERARQATRDFRSGLGL